MTVAAELTKNETLKRQLLHYSIDYDSGLCDRTLKACDKALKGVQRELKAEQDLVNALQTHSGTQEREITRLRGHQDSWLNNKYFWFGIGVVAGGLTLGYLTRK